MIVNEPEILSEYELHLVRPITLTDLAVAFGPDLVFEESPDDGSLTFSHPLHTIRIHPLALDDSLLGPRRDWSGLWWEDWWDDEAYWETIMETMQEDADVTPPLPIPRDVLATFTHSYVLEMSNWYSAPSGLQDGLDTLVSRVGGLLIDNEEGRVVLTENTEEWVKKARAQAWHDTAHQWEDAPVARPVEDEAPSALRRWMTRLALGMILVLLLVGPWALVAWGWAVASERLMNAGAAFILLTYMFILILVLGEAGSVLKAVLLRVLLVGVPEAALCTAAWLAARASDMDLLAYFAAMATLLLISWVFIDVLLHLESDVGWRRLERSRRREMRRSGQDSGQIGERVLVLPVVAVEPRGISGARRSSRGRPCLLVAGARGVQLRTAGRLRSRTVLEAPVSRLSLWAMVGYSTDRLCLDSDQPVLILETPESCLSLAVLTSRGERGAVICQHGRSSCGADVVGLDEAATTAAGQDLARGLGLGAPAPLPRLLRRSGQD
ncbi:hypothetical protein ACSL103130_06980 [Actinomyces slackii]|uniref:Uncharacterized protein n=2 Tax=Actinomyces slackii TaxID=52774 RepID=A0A448K9D6_9ACTO|nr:Uncharacterised protein [Actinomyces slackii]